MRLLILSDLHTDIGGPYDVPAGTDYDLVVLTGDITAPGVAAVRWVAAPETFSNRPVIFVPGNHEYYGTELSSQLLAMRKAAEGTRVHVLHRDAIVLGGVRFLGATLWTDFSLPVAEGDSVGGLAQSNVGRALAAANGGLNDFRRIEVLSPVMRGEQQRSVRRLLTAEDTLAKHWVDRDWLRRELESPHDGPTVVVSHHAPHADSVAAKYRGDWLTPAFVSDLPASFFSGHPTRTAGTDMPVGGPVLWVHGHTHSSSDYTTGQCRVVSNPRGYRNRDGSFENQGFNPSYVIEVAVTSRSSRGDIDAPTGQASAEAVGNVYELRSGVVSLRSADEEPTDGQLENLAGRAWIAERTAAADMVDAKVAAGLAGVSRAVLDSWADRSSPKVIFFDHRTAGRTFPRWQFDPTIWPVVQRLAGALQGNSWAMLNWLETPLGALDGRTPRAALEQGELTDRVLDMARRDAT